MIKLKEIEKYSSCDIIIDSYLCELIKMELEADEYYA